MIHGSCTLSRPRWPLRLPSFTSASSSSLTTTRLESSNRMTMAFETARPALAYQGEWRSSTGEDRARDDSRRHSRASRRSHQHHQTWDVHAGCPSADPQRQAAIPRRGHVIIAARCSPSSSASFGLGRVLTQARSPPSDQPLAHSSSVSVSGAAGVRSGSGNHSGDPAWGAADLSVLASPRRSRQS